MTRFTFSSAITLGASLPQFDQATVKNEPMLFNCDLEHAFREGGEITRAFISALTGGEQVIGQEIVIDTRVHMLMPTWFPCIPGWHHDDVARTRSDGQPDYATAPTVQHCMALVNGEVAPTQFALGVADFEEVPLGSIVYGVWHHEVERAILDGRLTRYSVPSNRCIYFDSAAWHQGVQAIGNGWRWFGRASWRTPRKPTNELRQQVQVYLPFPMAGW